MDTSAEAHKFEIPLELQFSVRKAEIASQEMTWDQLRCALLNLYYQRLMEWQAVKELLAVENVAIDFDFPTDVELEQLAEHFPDEYEDDDDGEELLQPF